MRRKGNGKVLRLPLPIRLEKAGILEPDLFRQIFHGQQGAAHGHLRTPAERTGCPLPPFELRAHLVQQRDDGRRFVLIPPGIEPDRLDHPTVNPASLRRCTPFRLVRARSPLHVLGDRLGLLRTLTGEIPLNLMQEARLPEAPIPVDAEHLRRGAAGDGLTDLLDQRDSLEGVPQGRFVVVQSGSPPGFTLKGRDACPTRMARLREKRPARRQEPRYARAPGEPVPWFRSRSRAIACRIAICRPSSVTGHFRIRPPRVSLPHRC